MARPRRIPWLRVAGVAVFGGSLPLPWSTTTGCRPEEAVTRNGFETLRSGGELGAPIVWIALFAFTSVVVGFARPHLRWRWLRIVLEIGAAGCGAISHLGAWFGASFLTRPEPAGIVGSFALLGGVLDPLWVVVGELRAAWRARTRAPAAAPPRVTEPSPPARASSPGPDP